MVAVPQNGRFVACVTPHDLLTHSMIRKLPKCVRSVGPMQLSAMESSNAADLPEAPNNTAHLPGPPTTR